VPINDRTFRRTSRLFGFRFIWGGPASLNTNWLLTEGLRRHGYASEADELCRRARDLVARGGFNEFYDPLDGSRVGASDFGWATFAAIISCAVARAAGTPTHMKAGANARDSTESRELPGKPTSVWIESMPGSGGRAC
jgi:hypothetical protein